MQRIGGGLGSPRLGAVTRSRLILVLLAPVHALRPGHFHRMAAHMAPKLDSQGWIDATTASGRLFAFFVRSDYVWVRYQGKYKCVPLGGRVSIPAARALAGLITTEPDLWMDEVRAKQAGLPSE